MAIDKGTSRSRVRAIRDILNRDWDPVGVFKLNPTWPDDEYESYAARISAMIREGASDEALVAYLEWAEVDHIGLGPFNRARAMIVVTAIRNLSRS